VATILVVDDNHVLRAVMKRRLTRAGFDVSLATNGAEGVEAARAELPDLILMDMTMPVMDGWAATRALRGDSSTRHIPILAFTAHPMSGPESPSAVGCDGQVSKPFEFPEVLEMIDRLLQRGRTRTQEADGSPG
jgi:CheY-like chemotaxis protein